MKNLFFRTILTHRSFPMLANLIAVKRWSYLVHIKNETWWQCTTCPNELPSLFCLPPPNIFYLLFLQWNLCQELYLWWSVRRRKGHDIPCHLKHQPSLPPFHHVPKIRTTAGVHLQETCLWIAYSWNYKVRLIFLCWFRIYNFCKGVWKIHRHSSPFFVVIKCKCPSSWSVLEMDYMYMYFIKHIFILKGFEWY